MCYAIFILLQNFLQLIQLESLKGQILSLDSVIIHSNVAFPPVKRKGEFLKNVHTALFHKNRKRGPSNLCTKFPHWLINV